MSATRPAQQRRSTLSDDYQRARRILLDAASRYFSRSPFLLRYGMSACPMDGAPGGMVPAGRTIGSCGDPSALAMLTRSWPSTQPQCHCARMCGGESRNMTRPSLLAMRPQSAHGVAFAAFMPLTLPRADVPESLDV